MKTAQTTPKAWLRRNLMPLVAACDPVWRDPLERAVMLNVSCPRGRASPFFGLGPSQG